MNSDPYSAVREYVSNAHDATRGYEQPLIRVSCDDGVIQIEDNGCGMTEEVIMTAFTRIAGHYENSAGASIGRFGLGVLSAFMVADRLVVETQPEQGQGHRLTWEKGADTFELEARKLEERGTTAWIYLSSTFEALASEPEINSFLAKTFGMFTTPILVGSPGFVANRSYSWLARCSNPPTTGLILTNEAFDVLRQYCRLELLAAYAAHLPDGSRIFLGIPSAEHAPLDKHRVAFFSHGVWIQSDAARFFPENLAFVVGLVDHPAFALEISRKALAQDKLYGDLRTLVEGHILSFLETLIAERPTIADAVLMTHATMLLAHSQRSERLQALLKGHYRFDTNLGPKLWKEVKNFAEMRDGHGARGVYVLSADSPQMLALDAATAKGRQVVLASGTERLLLEVIAAQDGLQLADAKSLSADAESIVVPDAFRRLAALLATPLRKRGLPGVSFFQLGGDNSAPSMFKIAEGVDSGALARGSSGDALRKTVFRVEALLLNVLHPFVEKLAASAESLDGRMLQHASDVLYSIAALNSPFQDARSEAGQLVTSLLVDMLDVGSSRSKSGSAIFAKCFVALPYSERFAPVWQAIESILSKDPYGWRMVRADQDVREVNVLTSITTHIQTSRRFIADISGQNVNVLLELGMMLQRDPRGLLILTDDETFPLLPADLRGHTCMVYPQGLREDAGEFAAWFAKKLLHRPEFAAMRGNGGG